MEINHTVYYYKVSIRKVHTVNILLPLNKNRNKSIM